MSSVSKGKRFENFVAKQLEDAGFHIAFKSVRVRFGSIDFDNVWDIVAIKRIDEMRVSWVFVQCKSRMIYGKEKEKILNWMREYGFEGMSCFLAIKKREGKRIAIEWYKLLLKKKEETEEETDKEIEKHVSM